ncbi:MAG: response regulator [Cyanobacterium sp. T60_A2020_053]|nr:response regulator [Cyanobacterium sp. T60_A2020_053]
MQKILIVEDELIAAESLSVDLKKLNYEVIGIVTTGEKAIKKAQELCPDLILMDIMLKGKMDGITAAHHIYNELKIPIIYLSAYADTQTLQRAQTIPSYGYLVKPYKIADITTTIIMALAKHKEDCAREAILLAEKKLNQIKTQALATASHDLRAPLTSILGYTELIKDYGDRISDDKKQKYFNFIRSAITEMNDSLEDLLLISKAEEGKITLYPDEFNLVEYLQHLVDEHNNLSDKHQITLITKFTKYIACLDRKMLHHILNNLMSNAIKYSPNGGEIKIVLAGDNENIQLSIADQGIGIPDNYKKRLFQLFERAENVGGIKGNGLGLSIVKKAVEIHGGNIMVESEENQGTTFFIYLPNNLSI